MTETSWIVSFVFCCILFLFDCVILKLPARGTVYTQFVCLVVMHVVLKCTGMLLNLLTYFIVFWLM